jgi:ABC-type multidrug transport system ATPase subunit
MNQVSDATVLARDAVPDINLNELHFPSLSCKLETATLTCLVGPHRAQLRAYLFMLAGIIRPSHGSVDIFGRNVFSDQVDWWKSHSRIGYLSGVSPLLSVQHGLMNVMLPALYHQNKSFREVADRARMLIKELGCEFDPTTFPNFLNSLQRLRLALARALILEPSLLILDVPFHDLGANEREVFGELLGRNKRQCAVCMIGGLQYPQFLEKHASQIIFISEKKIIFFNSWTAILHAEDKDVQNMLRIFKSEE